VPVPIDTRGVLADLKEGVLTVTLPKSADAMPRRIEVS
jgi:HSP20 family molecular chaperone IbpA